MRVKKVLLLTECLKGYQINFVIRMLLQLATTQTRPSLIICSELIYFLCLHVCTVISHNYLIK